MSLNPYFHQSRKDTVLNPYTNYNGETGDNTNEQTLVSNLLSEHITQFGYKSTYIVRTDTNKDDIFGESVGSHFKNSFPLAIMMDANGMENEIAIAQFGYNVMSNVTIQCIVKECEEGIESLDIENRKYPMIGDLIYVPLLGKSGTLLEIKFIDDRQPSFVTGTWMLYTFRCQVFDMNSETFDTGIEQIDALNNIDNTVIEPISDIPSIKEESESIIMPEPNAWNTLLR